MNEKKLTSYKTIQVRSFLAVAYCRLANAYEVSSVGNMDYDLDKRIAYGACFAEYERVIKGAQTILTSIQAEKYVEAIIKSGDPELALTKISEIRRLISSKTFSVKNLQYFEGDAYYKLGNKKKAGVSYDKWLQLRSKTDNFRIPDEIIIRSYLINTFWLCL